MMLRSTVPLLVAFACATFSVAGCGGTSWYDSESSRPAASDEARQEEAPPSDPRQDREIESPSDGDAPVFGGSVETEALRPRPEGPVVADHHAADAFPSIPRDVLERASARFDVFYGHTSHGSQIMTGLGMLVRRHRHLRVNLGPRSLTLTEVEGDLGTRGDTLWADATRIVLRRRGSEHNVVMWSWCGGVSENTPDGIQTYLARMSALEREFPGVVFVYQTGHTDGSGPNGNLARGNAAIRRYCLDNDKVLFDFADIESFDPDGLEHPDASDACEWCHDWCRAHRDGCPRCDECAHSHCFNCLRKGQAFWWLLARLAGWSGR